MIGSLAVEIGIAEESGGVILTWFGVTCGLDAAGCGGTEYDIAVGGTRE